MEGFLVKEAGGGVELAVKRVGLVGGALAAFWGRDFFRRGPLREGGGWGWDFWHQSPGRLARGGQTTPRRPGRCVASRKTLTMRGLRGAVNGSQTRHAEPAAWFIRI